MSQYYLSLWRNPQKKENGPGVLATGHAIFTKEMNALGYVSWESFRAFRLRQAMEEWAGLGNLLLFAPLGEEGYPLQPFQYCIARLEVDENGWKDEEFWRDLRVS